MKFREAEEYLLSLGNEVSTMKLGLENISELLLALGDPQRKYLKVQVAGTNGKGSVCAFLDSICNTARIPTGTFTSPHLVSITERIQVNGSNIAEEEFAVHASTVRETAERLVDRAVLDAVPTFFEQITAIALLAFAKAEVELAILETGMGGRLDATTAANAEIAVITRLDLDHQQYLGETIEQIAAEKAAIVRKGCRVIIGPQSIKALTVLKQRCLAVGVDPKIIDLKAVWPRQTFIGLAGRHQVENAAIAAGVADELRTEFWISDEAIDRGLRTVRHPGRLEREGRYLFDGAHNIAGARVLSQYLVDEAVSSVTMIFAVMRDKPMSAILAALVPLADKVVLTQVSNTRTERWSALLDAMPQCGTKENIFVAETVVGALEIAEMITPPEGVILVTGSLYLIGEIKKLQQFEI